MPLLVALLLTTWILTIPIASTLEGCLMGKSLMSLASYRRHCRLFANKSTKLLVVMDCRLEQMCVFHSGRVNYILNEWLIMLTCIHQKPTWNRKTKKDCNGSGIMPWTGRAFNEYLNRLRRLQANLLRWAMQCLCTLIIPVFVVLLFVWVRLRLMNLFRLKTKWV
jgi:hypothetical protein